MTATPAILPSYDHGASDRPLLGETIGENFDRMATAHADREALADRTSGRRWTYSGAAPRRAGPRPRAAPARHRQGRPGRHLGAELPGVDAPAIRHRRDRRDPGADQPGVPHRRARVRRQPGGHPTAGGRVVLQNVGLRRDDRGCPPGLPRPAMGRPVRQRRLARPARPRGRPACARGPAGAALAGRPDQHPVHVRNHRAPQGRDTVAPQHPQQRPPDRRDPGLHRTRPHLRARPAVSHVRHGDRQPRGHHPRFLPGVPGAGLRPGGHAGGRGGGALHVAVRRARDVHRRAGPARLRCLRPELAAYRGHRPARPARSRS